MYLLTLAIHSLLRWAVLGAGLVALVRALAGARTRREWSAADSRAGLWFVIAMDLQLLIGLVLYLALSPITAVALQDFSGVMGNSMLRFWAVEHIVGMVAAVALVHIGRARIRTTQDAARRHKLAAIFFGLALVAIMATIPWPGTPAGRPLLRGL